jgi:hypothetical protein
MWWVWFVYFAMAFLFGLQEHYRKTPLHILVVFAALWPVLFLFFAAHATWDKATKYDLRD